MGTPHVHAEVIRAYANGAEVEYFDGKIWRYIKTPIFYEDYKFRVKPRTFPIGEWEAPVPETTTPQEGQQYHAPDLVMEGFTCSYTWRGDAIDERLLARGLLHLTREAAFQHGRALAAFSENIENA